MNQRFTYAMIIRFLHPVSQENTARTGRHVPGLAAGTRNEIGKKKGKATRPTTALTTCPDSDAGQDDR